MPGSVCAAFVSVCEDVCERASGAEPRRNSMTPHTASANAPQIAMKSPTDAAYPL